MIQIKAPYLDLRKTNLLTKASVPLTSVVHKNEEKRSPSLKKGYCGTRYYKVCDVHTCWCKWNANRSGYFWPSNVIRVLSAVWQNVNAAISAKCTQDNNNISQQAAQLNIMLSWSQWSQHQTSFLLSIRSNFVANIRTQSNCNEDDIKCSNQLHF